MFIWLILWIRSDGTVGDVIGAYATEERARWERDHNLTLLWDGHYEVQETEVQGL